MRTLQPPKSCNSPYSTARCSPFSVPLVQCSTVSLRKARLPLLLPALPLPLPLAALPWAMLAETRNTDRKDSFLLLLLHTLPADLKLLRRCTPVLSCVWIRLRAIQTACWVSLDWPGWPGCTHLPRYSPYRTQPRNLEPDRLR